MTGNDSSLYLLTHAVAGRMLGCHSHMNRPIHGAICRWQFFEIQIVH